MDLNYLYHRQQVALFMADNAATDAARRVHGTLAHAYAGRIAAAKNPPAIAKAA